MGKGTRYYVPRTRCGGSSLTTRTKATNHGELQAEPVSYPYGLVQEGPEADRARRRSAEPGARRAVGQVPVVRRRSSTTRISSPSLSVCTKCAHHFRMNATERLRMLFDGDWTEHDADLRRLIR